MESEQYVNENIGTVFFAQTFCAKNQLAKYLADKYQGLYIDIDGISSNSAKAKIEAFFEVEMKPVYFLDAGTTWSKILKVENGKKEYSVIKTSDLKNLNLDFEIITGHSINKIKGKYENEVVALSYGVDRNELQNETVLDLGSRDAKRIKFKNSKFQDMDWNTNCASAT